MRKWISVALALLILAGCAAQPEQISDIEPFEEPALPAAHTAQADGTAFEDVSWRAERVVHYYPEGSGEADAAYKLTYDKLVFFAGGDPANDTAACAVAEMNAQMDAWESELCQRVLEERVPYADRGEGAALPTTLVQAFIVPVDGYVNIRLDETADYGEASERAVTTFVFDARGEETSLYALTGLYTPETLIAQQVYNYIDITDPARQTFYGDLELDAITEALDLYNGFTVEAAGYALYFPAGTLALEDKGVMCIELSAESLYPDFVGESVERENYQTLQGALHKLAVACGGEYRGYEGMPDALSYTLFMAQVFEADRAHQVPQAEYEAAARSYFEAIPADLALGDGTVLQDGQYTIPAAPMGAYGLRIDDCRGAGEELTLVCMLLYGAPGSADWGELAPVDVLLKKAEGTACGYYLTGFLMN